MPSSRETYRITAAETSDPQLFADALNRIFSSLSDRLDALEGRRGTAQVIAPFNVVDSDGNLIHSFGSTST